MHTCLNVKSIFEEDSQIIKKHMTLFRSNAGLGCKRTQGDLLKASTSVDKDLLGNLEKSEFEPKKRI